MQATIALTLLLATQVPFTLARHNVPVIEMNVNGRTARLIVDTGCSQTLVAQELTTGTAPGLSSFRRAGLEVNGRYWEADITLGEQRWVRRIIGIIDLSQVREHYGKDIDGLLGQDLLLEFGSVTIDYRKKVITLEK
jgi:predicted aspartyl protease